MEQVQGMHVITSGCIHMYAPLSMLTACHSTDCPTRVVRLADDAQRCGQAPCPLAHQRSRMHERPRCQASVSGAGASDASMPPARPPELEQCVALAAAPSTSAGHVAAST